MYHNIWVKHIAKLKSKKLKFNLRKNTHKNLLFGKKEENA